MTKMKIKRQRKIESEVRRKGASKMERQKIKHTHTHKNAVEQTEFVDKHTYPMT